MSFCPKCKSEYINGRPTCADCGTPLVDSLEELLAEEPVLQEESETDDELENGSSPVDETEKETDDESRPERVYTFVSKKEKYKDYRSTGYTFLIVSVAGLILITLNLLKLIQVFHVSGASAILFYGVMYVMFGIFLFVSINSFRNSRRLKNEADTEDTYLQDMRTFLLENITPEIFSEIQQTESEEELYFQRTEIIKNCLLEKYPQIDISLLEQTVDETYDRIFGK